MVENHTFRMKTTSFKHKINVNLPFENLCDFENKGCRLDNLIKFIANLIHRRPSKPVAAFIIFNLSKATPALLNSSKE
uniref:Uncharacterized protein n=1 Tax=Romanomermis culicivorax TaxID=13658 RepID=A0A915ITC9_ROMCU